MMNWKFILVYLAILLIPVIFIITLFSFLGRLSPTLAGYDILTLTKLFIYIILPIIFIVTIILSVFKFKIKFDVQTSLIILIVGFILSLIVVILMTRFLVPNLGQISSGNLTGSTGVGIVQSNRGVEFRELFRNILCIQSAYLAFLFSIFLSQVTNKKSFKILIFIFGGLLIMYIFSSVGLFILTLLT